ncbi:MAG: hypothetical protein H7Z39_16360 [Burkholderiaceae bacterium]|nr:hypothetical protein [Burkholderiaceae bacterium]
MSTEETTAPNVVRIDIDQSSLLETLALTEKIEAAALRAGEALVALGAAAKEKRVDQVIDALCAMAVGGHGAKSLADVGRALPAAIRVAIADLSDPAGAELADPPLYDPVTGMASYPSSQ